MLTAYNATHDKAIEGQPIGDWRESRPMQLPWLPQITTVTSANGAGSTDWVFTITDEETGQVYTLTVPGSATEATLDSNAETAFAAHPKLPSLFTLAVTSPSDVIAVFTAKHANRGYTFAVTGGTGANTIVETQSHGGAGLEFGRFVAKASTGDKDFRALEATDDLRSIVGLLFRTDGNHFHSLENDTYSAVDACQRGKTYAIAEEGRFWMIAEDAVTPTSRVYARKATTASAGAIGRVRGTPAGVAQTATITVVADMQVYAVKAVVIVNGERRELEFQYAPTDGTTTTDDAVDGLEAAGAAAILASGLTGIVSISAASASATFTLVAAAGYQFEYVDGTAFNEDAEAEALTVAQGTQDVDTIDITAIARFESTAAAGALVEVHIDLAP